LRTRFISAAVATFLSTSSSPPRSIGKTKDLVFEQVTQFPREQGTTLKIKSSRPAPRAIHVRIPSWTTEDAQVKINGRPIEAMADPGIVSLHSKNLAGWRYDQHRPPNETPSGAIARRRLGGCGTIRPASPCSRSMDDQRYSVYWQLQSPKKQSQG
jgi:hypothetical protein